MAVKFSATQRAQEIAESWINGNITWCAETILKLSPAKKREHVMFCMDLYLGEHDRNLLQNAINRAVIHDMQDRGVKDADLYIAYRKYKTKREASYVRELKPSGPNARGDWGYVSDYRKAIPMTAHHLKRFQADCRYMGDEAGFTVWRG